ncbi:enoyl-CoA hydratase-related protein [Actinomycetospora lutea]|uniref:enoyl-CoA hydratase/isomerase family protein n=1 Tax=Actinomycetospora lutea TaxID=663604 RepID=UPI0023672582|nr:enoyl-CoA hydratase-related protein [Actinomycetospora lutea]MDD7940345.1 enoyl-CoA hydratase-related protein [Actinomycetospora lutea]
MVHTERTDDVLHVTFDRPEKRNALRRADLDAVTDLLDDRGLRAVVFRGAGDRAFSAGVDINEFLALDGPDAARAFITALRDLLAAVRTVPAVTICAVDGPCLGGAFELALAADLRVVTTRARFGLPEVRLGIPSVIDAALLQQFVGLGHAKEMILTGDVYDVDAPQLAALCARPVAPDDLEAAVSALLGRVAGHTRTVVAAQKRLFETWQSTPLAEGAARSVEEFAGVFAAADTRAALAAYRSSLGGG